MIKLEDHMTWPQVGSVWSHTNGNAYQVLGYTNIEMDRQDKYPTTIRYRNMVNGRENSRPLMDWEQSMVYVKGNEQEYAPWHPITNTVALKTLGKLGEEAGELSTIICRAIIQGLNGIDPRTGKTNFVLIQEEMADVIANMQLVGELIGADDVSIHERAEYKIGKLRTWHRMA